ncbi:SGNH/GDSL hydrolase family protein, partial [Actibacterium sp. 188UL27-1]|uniref:SGNH/GDSL hydrolase family protein n=1 Tax=Actibacterium sp. 188UL27-1 TaxID=2786961 RepID=UPI001EB17539|nr:hypothetical protein [Actibacterium sp. 188UL27-1]
GVTADGDVVIDLSGLSDGALTSTILATDANGATTTTQGPALALDTAPAPPTALNEDFSNGAAGFSYFDDAFRGTSEPGFADGLAADGVLRVTLGGGNTKSTISDISGGWSTTFNTVAGQSGELTLRYRLEMSAGFDVGEFGEVLVSVDGVETVVARLDAANNDTSGEDTGFVDVVLDLGALSAGNHTLTLGGYINQRTRKNEVATIEFDSVSLGLGAPSAADDDGNLSLSAPVLLLDLNDAATATFTVAGLDADTTGVVSVTDGVSTVQAAASNGAMQLDLSGLNLGSLTSQVVATDGDGATATAAGPALTLVPAGADDDGNLVLSAPDMDIDSNEQGAVTFTVAGLDADATGVISVTDGVSTATGGVTADGDVVIDLSGLSDGALTSTILATDANGATTTTQGPALTLDTAPRSDFSSETAALSINLQAGTFSEASKVLVIGDSLSLGVGDTNLPLDVPALEGWREDLFEQLQSQNVWIDYVGGRQNGPSRMLDTDHSAEGGVSLAKITDGRSSITNITANVNTHEPDILLFMAGTNDYSFASNNFFNRYNGIITHLDLAIDQFFAANQNPDAHLVISSLAPKTEGGAVEIEFAEFLLEGFSRVNGVNVVGDVGNGTYRPGYRATVETAQQTHDNLHFFENPVTGADLTTDNVHYTGEGYATYANALSTFLQSEIGFIAGTLDGSANALGQSTAVSGGSAGDLIVGNGQANSLDGNGGNDVLRGEGGNDQLNGGDGIDRLEGGSGIDLLTGGAGADAFVFNTDFANGHGANDADSVLDFDFAEDWFVFVDSFDGQIQVTDGPGASVVLTVGSTGEIVVTGSGVQSLKGADLGGGVFSLTDDPNVIQYVDNTDFFLS